METKAGRLLALSAWIFVGTICANGQNAPAPELPRPSIDIQGITPEVLSRTAVPGVPSKIALVTRVRYEPRCASWLISQATWPTLGPDRLPAGGP
jgi:hypothetical protein